MGKNLLAARELAAASFIHAPTWIQLVGVGFHSRELVPECRGFPAVRRRAERAPGRAARLGRQAVAGSPLQHDCHAPSVASLRKSRERRFRGETPCNRGVEDRGPRRLLRKISVISAMTRTRWRPTAPNSATRCHRRRGRSASQKARLRGRSRRRRLSFGRIRGPQHFSR